MYLWPLSAHSFGFPFPPSRAATHAAAVLTGLQPGEGKKSLGFIFCIFFLLFDSIYMGSLGLGVYYVILAGCEEEVGGGGDTSPCTITIETWCRQHHSAVPQEVSKITPWVVQGAQTPD